MLHEDVTDRVIAAAISVHSGLGAGLLESAYHACLLTNSGEPDSAAKAKFAFRWSMDPYGSTPAIKRAQGLPAASSWSSAVSEPQGAEDTES